MSKAVTNRMLQKLSLYLTYLKGLPEQSPEYISATMIAEGLKMGGGQCTQRSGSRVPARLPQMRAQTG